MKRHKDRKRERRWRGVAVSEGAAAGRVLRVHQEGRQRVFRATLAEEDVEREARRFRAAARLVRRQLSRTKKRAERVLGEEHAYVFEAHLLMVEDKRFLEEIEQHVRDARVNAEWAVKVATDRLLAAYAEIEDDYLRERNADVEDVTRRLLNALSGEPATFGSRASLPEDAVIVAEELLPSVAAEFDSGHVKAIATEAGGWTSHTAIIARGLGVPAVFGARDLYHAARTGDEIIVDARSGEIILHPTASTLARFREQQKAARSSAPATTAPGIVPRTGGASTSAQEESDGRAPARTLDGVEVALRANVELPAEYEAVRRYGAQGIGLFRSEFLLTQRREVLSEDEQCEAYARLAELAAPDGVTVRLFDLGGEKFAPTQADAHHERNPALGLRAIRFCLRRDDLLRAQARAVMRAAARGRLDLVLPMVSDVSDVRRARAVIDEERVNLMEAGEEVGEVRVGAMIEVPAAAAIADRLAREVDFFSLGTNDLIQYLLAVDRGNDEVADWFRTLHPAVLLSIKRTLDAARDASIRAVVCGEMAATPAYAVVLVGLGARDLSMTATAIPRMRRVLAGISAARAREFAAECLEAAGANESEEVVRTRFGHEWPHLFPPDFLPRPKTNG